MANQRRYPHGVTCWIDTEQADLDAATEFYRGLFGWSFTVVTPVGAPLPYLIAAHDGHDVCGLGAAPKDPASQGPAKWNTYVAVDDADATAAAVPGLGGTVLSPPVDAGPGGRSATVSDPFGCEFRLWQARQRLGAQHINAPGGWNFSDLYTPDRDAAMAFYTPLFGWRAADMEMDAGTMIQVPGYGDHLAATADPDIYERQAAAPPGFADVIGGLVVTKESEPAGWHVVFSVADRDASAATAERLGATVLAAVDDVWTKNAVIRDPQGAEFTVSQFTPPDGDW